MKLTSLVLIIITAMTLSSIADTYVKHTTRMAELDVQAERSKVEQENIRRIISTGNQRLEALAKECLTRGGYP